MRKALRRLAKRLGFPMRAYFNPRFESMHSRLIEVERHLSTLRQEHILPIHDLAKDAQERTMLVQDALGTMSHTVDMFQESVGEVASILGRSLDNLTNQSGAALDAARGSAATIDEMHEMLRTQHAETQQHIGKMRDELLELMQGAADAVAARIVPPGPEVLTPDRAEVLAREVTGLGHAARTGLWFNPPVWVSYRSDGPFVKGISERIVEHPYVMKALAAFRPGAEVLDVGATESTLSVSLAAIGFRVTAVDPRPYPLRHPNLTVVVGGVEELEGSEQYDAIICLSTLEHIGIAAYGSHYIEDADLHAATRMRQLARPDALLVLTAPYANTGSVMGHQRVYDESRLSALLQGWHVEDRSVAVRMDSTTWVLEGEGSSGSDDGERVVMLIARAKQ